VSDRSLVQRSPTDCGVSECDRESVLPAVMLVNCTLLDFLSVVLSVSCTVMFHVSYLCCQWYCQLYCQLCCQLYCQLAVLSVSGTQLYCQLAVLSVSCVVS